METDLELLRRTPVLIVPGWQNSLEDHWQTRWEKKFGWRRVNQRDWDYPQKEEWIAMLLAAVQRESVPPVLVCHSLACPTLAHAAGRNPRLALKGAFIVAPADVNRADTPSEIAGFRSPPLTRLPFPSWIIASTNDPYCTIERAAEFAKAWGSKLINVGERHHIGTIAQLGEWEEGQKLFAQFLRTF